MERGSSGAGDHSVGCGTHTPPVDSRDVPVTFRGRRGPSLPGTLPRNAPAAFHLLAKPSGAVCNLACDYCFFLSKDQLYPGARFRMSDEVLRAYLRQLIEGHRTTDVVVAFQGGEPTLLGKDFFRRAVAFAREVAGPGRQLEFSVQTNGTLLDDEWAELFAEDGFLVGLSIDGPAVVHDRYRVDKRGAPTHERVVGAWRLLSRHGVDTNILCAVNAHNGDRGLETYRYFRDELGARFLQFIPIVERATPETIEHANRGWGEGLHRPLYRQAGSLVTERSVRPDQWGRFLVEVFDEWVRHDVGEVFVPAFEAALAAWLGLDPSMCIFKRTCGTALALEHNGDVYSCDHYVEPEHRLGNVLQHHLVELVASPEQHRFGKAKATLPAVCEACDVRFACNGECPRNRFVETTDDEPDLNYLCAGYKRFFHHIDEPMRVMAAAIERGGFADEVMEVLAR